MNDVRLIPGGPTVPTDWSHRQQIRIPGVGYRGGLACRVLNRPRYLRIGGADLPERPVKRPRASPCGTAHVPFNINKGTK
jgi:hypothetical protein